MYIKPFKIEQLCPFHFFRICVVHLQSHKAKKNTAFVNYKKTFWLQQKEIKMKTGTYSICGTQSEMI